ncbi:23284_t:CDS:1, partial [Gigaspora rosea]
EAKTEMLIALLDHPREIEDQVKNLLPFELPLTDRRRVRAAVIALRQVFAFDRLPDTCFANDRTPLPEHPGWLNETTRKMFPIT